MNTPRVVFVAMFAAVAGPALAQQLAEPIPRRAAPIERPMPSRSAQQQNAAPCPEFGPGFIRLPGSSTCLRASGQVRGETIVRDRRSQLDDTVQTRVRGTVQLETRTPTDIGPVRLIYRQRFDRPMNGS
jgi:hypothetical protein